MHYIVSAITTAQTNCLAKLLFLLYYTEERRKIFEHLQSNFIYKVLSIIYIQTYVLKANLPWTNWSTMRKPITNLSTFTYAISYITLLTFRISTFRLLPTLCGLVIYIKIWHLAHPNMPLIPHPINQGS